MKNIIKIANTQAFWGDRSEASSELLTAQPDIDYLTLDYLSEVSLSIMAVQRAKDSEGGYAKDFIEVIKTIIPFWKNGSKVKVITNAGGLAPQLCAEACFKVIHDSGLSHLKIAFIFGDNVLDDIKNHSQDSLFKNLETGEAISTVIKDLTTANAYLGAKPIVQALKMGADLIITGRVADPSMTVAPCMAHFDWSWTDYDKIAQATIAGHLIECGTQVTGGISTNWLNLSEKETIGYPIVEIDENANVVVTKSERSGGSVSIEGVKEQLLYEIGDPNEYLSPDAIISFLSIQLEEIGKNRIQMTHAKGKPPPLTYKVSASYYDGFKAEGMLAIFGRKCEEKARLCGDIILSRMKKAGYPPKKYHVECLGCGDLVLGVLPCGQNEKVHAEKLECLLRICVADPKKDVIEYFSKQIAPLVTSGPPGTTGYINGRPHIRPVFAYWPCLIESSRVFPKVELLT